MHSYKTLDTSYNFNSDASGDLRIFKRTLVGEGTEVYVSFDDLRHIFKYCQDDQDEQEFQKELEDIDQEWQAQEKRASLAVEESQKFYQENEKLKDEVVMLNALMEGDHSVEDHNEITKLKRELEELKAQLNQPETIDFEKGVVLEAAHQRERWGENHDAEKTDGEWFWVVGYLLAKIVHKDADHQKVNHWIITCAALCANWHYYRNNNQQNGD